jgi:hypothetical protein
MLNHSLLINFPDHVSCSYLPDFLPYQFENANTFRAYYRDLARKKGYLMVDGFGLKRVGFLRYCWESFKGWLGYRNHCALTYTQLISLKLTYWGYLNGYHSDADKLHVQSLIGGISADVDFSKHAVRTMNKDSSLFFQYHLLKLFEKDTSKELKQFLLLNPMYSPNYCGFGGVCLSAKQIEAYCALDTWTDKVNEKLILDRDFQHCCQSFNLYLKKKYAEIMYRSAIKQRDSSVGASITTLFTPESTPPILFLSYALYPQIAQHEPEFFMLLLFKKYKYDEAYKIITEMTDFEHAFALLGKYYDSNKPSFDVIRQHVALAMRFARHLVKKETDKRASWVAFLSRDVGESQNYLDALQLHPGIELEFPTVYFDFYCRNKKWEKAYQLFVNHSDKQSLNVSAVSQLAKVFTHQGEECYKDALVHRESNLDLSISKYELSLKMKKRAYELDRSEANQMEVAIHLRLLAQAYFDQGKKNNTFDILIIGKIMQLLTEATKTCPEGEKDPKFSQLHRDVLAEQSKLPKTYSI